MGQLNKNNQMKDTGKFTKEVNSDAENQKAKFTKEVEETPQMEFVKFENEGDVIEGFITGETKPIGDPVKECFVIITGENNDKKMLLPSAVKLERKIKNLCSTKGDKIKSGVEVQITYLGYIKVDGVANKMKNFKVLTA